MTKVKICGITNLEDALEAIYAGADMLGFNFYSKSPRYISKEKCLEITSAISRFSAQVAFVGVFVNTDPVAIESTLRDCKLQMAQLHGDEHVEDLIHLKSTGYKAFRGTPTAQFLQYYSTVRIGTKPRFLIDSSTPEIYGGSGKTANWQDSAEIARKYEVLLAGGLNPANVLDAIQIVKPWGVDVASGVELNPRKKDISKLRSFIEIVKLNS